MLCCADLCQQRPLSCVLSVSVACEGTAGKRAVPRCPLKCSCVFYQHSCRITRPGSNWGSVKRAWVRVFVRCMTEMKRYTPSRSLKTQISTRFTVKVCISYCCYNRHIQANKVSAAPCGNSKQQHENKIGYIHSFIHLIKPVAYSRSGSQTARLLSEQLIGELGFPKHLLWWESVDPWGVFNSLLIWFVVVQCVSV